MSDEVAIRIERVSKDFVLLHEKASSLKGIFTSVAKKSQQSRHSDEIQHALKNISFEITKGEFFGIVGRNGSGKSTLLKILAGIYQPTSGNVVTNGKLVPFIELGVGFNPELTGRENVYLNGAMLGFSENQVKEMYDDIVQFAEIERFMDQKLKNYSSGMQVRLAFSMAVRAEADILLIDEVLAVGDADFQRKCFDYFRKLKKNRKTVVFVSHDMDAVREYCDRAMLIEKSAIVKIGHTSEVAQLYSKLFIETNTGTGNTTEPEEKRWGNGIAKTKSISCKFENNEIVIIQKIIAEKQLNLPIIGFRLRDATGKEITGTNNRIEGKSLPSLKKGESMIIEWRMPNILSDGSYSVDPAILMQDAVTVTDWWDEATQLVIKKERHLPYPIDPGFSIKVTID